MAAPASSWPLHAADVVELPSGRRVRGRGVRSGPPPAGLEPQVGYQCTWERPRSHPWPVRWVRWPDFGVPLVPSDARSALAEAWERAAVERVEICCAGGNGRTGTALAVLAVIDGVPPARAVGWVREHYRPHAVETPWQRWWVRGGAQGRGALGTTSGVPVSGSGTTRQARP